VVSGGFPCQDISAAGKGAGITGERSGLWKEFARIIGEVGPRFVFVENSPVLTSRGLGVVLGDLAAMGYDARWGVLGAEDAIWLAGDPVLDHERERLWIFAESTDAQRIGSQGGCEAEQDYGGACGKRPSKSAGVDSRADAACADAEGERAGAGFCGGGKRQEPELADGGGDAAAACEDTEQNRRSEVEPSDASGARGEGPAGEIDASTGGWWSAEPDVGRVADGVAHRVDRLAALGNGQVPAVVRLAWETLGRLRGGDFNDGSDRSDE
jgi:DNA (cytosine-5)-methyltransferase 1